MEHTFLFDDDNEIRKHSVETMLKKVDSQWPQYSEHVLHIGRLVDDEKFQHRELASLLLSKIMYHLTDYDESLLYAVSAGKLFDISSSSKYTKCIVGKIIDKYISTRKTGGTISKGLEDVFHRVIDIWTQSATNVAQRKEVVGTVLNARRLDLLDIVLTQAMKAKPEQSDELQKWTMAIVVRHSFEKEFRGKVLRRLCELFQTSEHGHVPNPIEALRCLITLDETEMVATILLPLIQSTEEDKHTYAKQISFELYNSCTPYFLKRIIDYIINDSSLASLPFAKVIIEILSGKLPCALQIKYLASKGQVNKDLLQRTKGVIEVPFKSVTHIALVVANCYMYCGTTKDTFLRENIDWLAKASNWSRFTATASIGVIHRGHVVKSLELLGPYLQSTGGGAMKSYQEGGALFALGLIHAPVCHDNPHPDGVQLEGDQADIQGQRGILKYIFDAIKDHSQDTQVLHGACLGIGLTGMTVCDDNLTEQLWTLLQRDDAVVGESAAVGIGLVLLGSKRAEMIERLIQYGEDTQHEKIKRGLMMAVALIMFRAETEADAVIQQLSASKEPIFRQGAVFTSALAYVGTGDNAVVERLLETAVTDVSDDVRRYAVGFLGFLFKKPKQCIDVVKLLGDSYNTHVRYGVALAISIACAGTGLKEAADVLWKLTKDNIDFVRQISYMGLAMLYIQSDKEEEIKKLRTTLEEKIKDKHEELMTKFGCILALGILECGGGKCGIALQRNSFTLMKSCVGMFMFSLYWYWHPYLLFLSMAFHPTITAEECLNSDLLTSSEMKVDEEEEPGPPEPFQWPAP